MTISELNFLCLVKCKNQHNVLLVLPSKFKFHCIANFQRWMSERTLGSPRQHRDIRQGGRGLWPAEQAELAAAHLRHRLRHPRPRPGFRLPQVAPPVEDHPAGGFFKESCNLTWLNFQGARKLELWHWAGAGQSGDGKGRNILNVFSNHIESTMHGK